MDNRERSLRSGERQNEVENENLQRTKAQVEVRRGGGGVLKLLRISMVYSELFYLDLKIFFFFFTLQTLQQEVLDLEAKNRQAEVCR